MYILLALIAATAAGVAVHFALPLRELRGVGLAPAVAAAAAAALYTGSTWVGLGEDSPWQWAITLGASAAVSVVVTGWLCRARAAADLAARRAAGIR